MSGKPDDAALAAIGAAYLIVVRARAVADTTTPVPRWRLAARIALDDAPAARVAGRRSAWRAATGP